MKKVLNCRRSTLALIAMGMLFVLGLVNKVDVGGHIVGVVLAIAGANATQAIMERKKD